MEVQTLQKSLRILQLKLSARDAKLLSERERREELEAQLESQLDKLAKAGDNNRSLARQNAWLLERVERLKVEGELAAHELATRTAVFRAREAESLKEAGRLMHLLQEATQRITELQAALGQHELLEEAGSCGSAAAARSCCVVYRELQRDDFEADAAASADSASTQPGGAQAFPALCIADQQQQQQQQQPCSQDSFLVCADSATSTTQRCTPSRVMADCADSATRGGLQHEEEECTWGSCGGSASPMEESWFGQQEQRPPPHALRLPNTVRLMAGKGRIAWPQQPLQPLGGPPPPARRALQPPQAELAAGGANWAAGSSGAAGSEGSNDPEGSGPPQAAGAAEARNAPCAGSTHDRESATAPPAQQLDCTSGAPAVASCAVTDGASELSSGMQEGRASLRSSTRTKGRRVSYALPNLRVKLRQGDEFTFGDPATRKPRARTKPKPRFQQPAPAGLLSIPAALEEEEDVAAAAAGSI